MNKRGKTTLKSLLVTGYIWNHVFTVSYPSVSEGIAMNFVGKPFVLPFRPVPPVQPSLGSHPMSHAIQTWLGKHRWYSSNDGIFRKTFVSFQGSKIRWRFLTCWFSLQVQKVEKIANTVNPPVTYCSTTSKNQLSILWICQSQNDYRLEHEPLDFETKKHGNQKISG